MDQTKNPKKKLAWLLSPALLWMIFFLVIPAAIILFYSFFKKGLYGGIDTVWTFANYERASEAIYLKIVWDSFKLAAFTSFLCLLIGYPMAYVMATSRSSWRNALMILLVIPFWTNLVVRTYAIKLLLGDQGPVNEFLVWTGLISEPIPFANSYASVVFGMVTNYLPFMVLPLYVTLEKFDFSLLEAGRDLGASSWDLLTNVLLPLTKSGIVTGCLLVFTPALGEFLIPDLLGGARTMLIGNLIIDQFLKMRDWPFGSALSMLLMAVVVVTLMICMRWWSDESSDSKERT